MSGRAQKWGGRQGRQDQEAAATRAKYGRESALASLRLRGPPDPDARTPRPDSLLKAELIFRLGFKIFFFFARVARSLARSGLAVCHLVSLSGWGKKKPQSKQV